MDGIKVQESEQVVCGKLR